MTNFDPEASRPELGAEPELRTYREKFPCDGDCNPNDRPDEQCSLHGRSPRDLWDIIDFVRSERDEANARIAAARERLHATPIPRSMSELAFAQQAILDAGAILLAPPPRVAAGMTNRDKALAAIESEGLRGGVFFQEPVNCMNSVAIYTEDGTWVVSATDERAVEEGRQVFDGESAALESFLDRLRAHNRYLESSRARRGPGAIHDPE